MKANPLTSKGARMERAAFRAYLRRLIIQLNTGAVTYDGHHKFIVKEVLNWVLKRQERYDKRKGGLGR